MTKNSLYILITQLIFSMFMLGCNSEPDAVDVSDEQGFEPSPSPSLEEVLNEQEEALANDFINNGEILEGVDLYYCNVGIYQEPAIMVIEEEVTDEINGDGDYAKVSGYYYYIKIQKNLDLEGGLDIINQQYMLNESYKGKPSGYMQFSLGDYGEDYWAVSEDDNDKQDFLIEKIEPHDKEARKYTIKKQKYSDTHEVQDLSAEEEIWEAVTDNLAMVFVDEDKMFFDYSVVRTNFHMGSASGLALKNETGNYVFKGEEGCELTFKVAENNVEVIEDGCGYYHGARATLDGTYSK